MAKATKNKKSEEGRHVGLDFYDLLIEVLYRMRPITRAQAGSVGRAGRVRYSCLKEAARGGGIYANSMVSA